MIEILFEHLQKISNFSNLLGCGLKTKHATPISNSGPPRISKIDKVGHSQSARSSQGLLVLAPQDFCTFRRPWITLNPGA